MWHFPALALALGLAVLACGGGAASPEGQVRSLLGAAQRDAEAMDVKSLRARVSEAYADDEGQDKRAIEGLLAYHFLRNRSVHLLTRIDSVAIPEAGRAEATVFVAMAGRPIARPEQLGGISASLYRFDFDLALEDGEDWRVTRADWRRARRRDFF
jgi:hypothetical protein